jgi:hypothetical protein
LPGHERCLLCGRLCLEPGRRPGPADHAAAVLAALGLTLGLFVAWLTWRT